MFPVLNSHALGAGPCRPVPYRGVYVPQLSFTLPDRASEAEAARVVAASLHLSPQRIVVREGACVRTPHFPPPPPPSWCARVRV